MNLLINSASEFFQVNFFDTSTYALFEIPPFPQHPTLQGLDALQVVVCATAKSVLQQRMLRSSPSRLIDVILKMELEGQLFQHRREIPSSEAFCAIWLVSQKEL
jgi:hypothetical protein